MPRHDLRTTILQMRDHAVEAVAIARGMERRHLDEERVLNLALIRLVEVVGEAASRVPREVQGEHPSVPWAEIIGMRNRLIHGYDQVDIDVLWEVLRVDFPPLIEQLERMLSSLD